MGEGFWSCSTAAAGGFSPEAAAVHIRAEGKAFVVKGGKTNAFAKGLGGKGVVDGIPVEKVKHSSFVAGEFFEVCP